MYREPSFEFESAMSGMDVMTVALIRRVSMNSKSPSYLAGWHFLRIVESDDIEALSIKAVPSADGPTISFNLNFIEADYLEDSSAAMLWLPLALNHLCTEMLLEDGEDGLFRARHWQDFRSTACSHLKMEWDDVLASTDRLGTSYMAEALASAMFVESGLMDVLIARRDDQKNGQLKSA
jgi:hypothetical protein